jgi:hypothetical protein
LIDVDAFSSALSAGDLDACLQLLRSCDADGSAGAVLNCRAAEALFHSGNRDEAIECGRRALALAADDHDTAHFCAWLFSNCIGINTTLTPALRSPLRGAEIPILPSDKLEISGHTRTSEVS